MAIADELDDLTDDDARLELELDLALDELELMVAIEALLIDELFDVEELGAITTTEDEALLKLVLEELVVTLVLDVLDELTMATELVLLDDELIAGGGSLGKAVGVEDVVPTELGVFVPAPPQALNTKVAANSSERDSIFIIQIH